MTAAAGKATQDTTAKTLLWAIGAAVLARLLTLGLYPLADTSEARYAEIARKMLELNDWVTPWYQYGVPFWGKPPMSTWLTAASFKVFGVNEFAARLPHFAAAALVAWLVWDWTHRRSPREALLALALLCGAAGFYLSAGAVLTDMALLTGTTLAMRGFWLGIYGTDAERRSNRWLLFVGLGFGLLAKGPVALVLVGLPIAAWAVAARAWRLAWRSLPWLSGSLIVALLAVPWYWLAEQKTPGFLDYFLVGEHWQRFTTAGWAGDRYGTAHAFPRGSIWFFLLLACLPWALLLPLLALGRAKVSAPTGLPSADRSSRLYLMLWGFTPCLFFTTSGNVLWTYVLPGMPALALLVAGWLAADTRQRRVDHLLVGGLVAVSIAICGYVIGQQGPGGRTTAKALVRHYESLKVPGESLVFLGIRPYSADFYSSGQAERVIDATALAKRLETAPVWVALRGGQYNSLPAPVQHRLQSKGRHGSYDLFYAAP